MKLQTILAVFAFCAISVLPAKAWTCPSGQIRQQAPAGTPTTAPGYDVIQGIPFICVPATQTSQSQTQTQQQTQTANGGNANSKSNSSSNSSATSNSTSHSNSNSAANANGNGDNSNNTSFNYPRQVASAFAPETFPTVSCFKSGSIAGQGGVFGFSAGGGRIDENCAELEAARQAPSLIARCKIYITNKYVKRAGVTLEDCLQIPQPAVVLPAPVLQPQPIIVNVPPVVEPPITVNFELPVPAPAVPVLPAPKHITHRIVKPCPIN